MRRPLSALLSTLLLSIALLAGCVPKAEPLPATPDAIEKLQHGLSKRSRNYDARNKDLNIFLNVYKEAVEQDAGYSFDLTIRDAFIHRDARITNLLANVMQEVIDQPDTLVDNGFITAETRKVAIAAEIVDTQIGMTPAAENLLDTVRKCIQQYNGSCTYARLQPIMYETFSTVADTIDQHAATGMADTMYNNLLYTSFDSTRIYRAGWVRDQNNERVDLWSLNRDPHRPFTLNERAIYAATDATKLIEGLRGNRQ